LDLLPEHRELASVAKSVARDIGPGYRAREEEHKFPAEAMRKFADAGLLGLNASTEAGGQGAGELALGVVCEELAYVDPALASLVVQSGTALKLLHGADDASVRQDWVPRVLAGETAISLALTEPDTGSDLRATRTSARKEGDEWIISGEKSSVSHYSGDAAFVLAKTDDGTALFLVPLSLPGVSKFPYNDLGMLTAGGRASVVFDDVRIPDRFRLTRQKSGLRGVLGPLSSSKVIVCLEDIGVARASLDDAIAWVKTRETFGAPLSHRQGIAFPIADYICQIEMARTWCYRCLWLVDQGRDFKRDAAIAKAVIPEQMSRICHDVIIIIGHTAYSREHLAQARLRDIIATELGEGSTNIQRMIISRELFGVRPG
jgi:cyclohexanecarboxyl-CoA dehydrogenase